MTGNTVATGGGRYRVYVDDVEVSAHTQIHTAIDRMRAEQVENPESEVNVVYDFTLRYEPSDWELEGVATDPADEEEPVDDNPDETNPDPEPEVGETIPTDESNLTTWEDPTQLDIYKEYDPVEPKSYELDKSLSDIATEMEPGEWYRLPDAPMTVAASWSDKMAWDQDRQRLSWLGHHQIPRPTRWAMIDFKNNLMHKQVGNRFHPKAGIDNQWGFRSYGKYTQLSDGSNVYARFNRLWKQDPETLEWSAWVMHPRYETISNIEYFPEMDAVVSLAAQYAGSENTKLCAYYVDTGEWRTLPRPYVQGRHSMMRYNPTRGEVMLLGGDDSFRAAQILLPDGSLKACADCPRDTRIKTDQLAVDPVSGHYLVMIQQSDDERGKSRSEVEFFGYNPDADEWYVISEFTRDATWVDNDPPSWPFTSKHARPAVTALPEHGVTLWAETARPGMHLYKHVEV